ncbi:MAG: NAD(P)H nitroreductase [Bacteroidetes bacterium GWA2_31_9]|nr:MAG: NAD(P)H nitroreductase [Bacteroidetes bacterium GWA2_31_9]
MNFTELSRFRQSVRKYKSQPVPKEKIEHCVEAARIAPSACNSQPWSFIIVDEPALKEKVAKETYSTLVSFNKFTLQAPAIVVLVVEKPKIIAQIGGRIKSKDYYLFDVGIAAEHFCLQAAEEGLGTCMLGWFNEKAIMKLLNIPKSRSIGLLITIGYSDEENIREKKRKSFKDIIYYNEYKG